MDFESHVVFPVHGWSDTANLGGSSTCFVSQGSISGGLSSAFQHCSCP